MKKLLCLLLAFTLLLCSCSANGAGGEFTNPPDDALEPVESSSKKHTVTVDNPLIWSDVPDPDIIRVGDTYYMVSTTMYFYPGAPIMKSKDLAHWELVCYTHEILEKTPETSLFGDGHMYSRGSWAASIRYHDGNFYVLFAALNLGKTYIYKTADIENPDWQKITIGRAFHDASLFFEDDGIPYVIHGAGNVHITQLKKDCSDVQPGGVDQLLFNTGIAEGLDGAEGAHFYKINGTYYCTMISYATNTPGVARCQITYRSKNLLDGWEGKVVLADSMDYYGSGVAQGGIVQTPEEDWYALLFQDHGAVGRVPVLQPVTWVDGWPIPGEDGKAVKTVKVKSDAKEFTGSTLMTDDEFDYADGEPLKLEWQFNHIPNDRYWSVTERKGCFRITTSRVDKDIFHALNTLTQRAEGPTSTHEVLLYTDGLQAGDYAGISAFQTWNGMVGVRVDENGDKYAYFATMKRTDNNFDIVREEKIDSDKIYLRIEYKFSTIDENDRIETQDQARFYYSLDGENWEKIGKGFTMSYDLDLFTGYRTALYCYSTKTEGGYADFEYFHVVD